MWVSSIMGLNKLILPDGRNRLGGYMKTVSVIGNNDSWWNQLQHYACTRTLSARWLHDTKLFVPRMMS